MRWYLQLRHFKVIINVFCGSLSYIVVRWGEFRVDIAVCRRPDDDLMLGRNK